MKIESLKLYFRIKYDVSYKIWDYYHQGFEDMASVLEKIYTEKLGVDDIFVVSTCSKWHEIYVDTNKCIKDMQAIIKTIDLDEELKRRM